jgi:hypothetical protein
MKRLFLALAVLAFAGGARAEDAEIRTEVNGVVVNRVTALGAATYTPSGAYQATWHGPWSVVIGGANDWMVKISPDGTIEYSKDYTPDAAAKAFWDAIGLERKQRVEK